MRNYYFFIVILCIFCITILGIGFSIVGSPLSQKAIRLDQQRLDDFAKIYTDIGTYYIDNNRMPNSLSELENKVKNKYTNIKDPETKKEYSLQPVGQNKFKLCTTFSTDTTKEKKVNDPGTDIRHPKGDACISYPTISISNSNIQSNGIWKSTTNLPTPLYEATTQIYSASNIASFIYQIGGYDPVMATTVSTVNYTKTNTDGTLNLWQKTEPLPQGLRAASSVLYATGRAAFLYVMGGEYDDQNRLFSNNVYMAQINYDGKLLPWNTVDPVVNTVKRQNLD